MMTPQEVANHAFAKATLGGYNMAMVDEFLDQLTKDYTTLFNDNAILKNKLKVLSDTVEEYRATDDAMRKTLLAAQKMAEAMVADAENRKAELVHEAEEAARLRINELRAEIAAEEYRLQAAQESTAAYVAELTKLFEGQRDFLAGLNGLKAQAAATAVHVESTTSDIEEAMSQFSEPTRQFSVVDENDFSAEDEDDDEADCEAVGDDEQDAPPASDSITSDPVLSARFEDLQFGRDYEIS